ncbi:hypothetical protein OG298_43975 (plasmid) [Streptomyces sp. NBC_01005]|uniref:hypothetical protein n=1 Tax=unclassified Streptomyces TaxID=2593676 RepID=UPI0038681B63|nr:hypothetical protein OG298_43975 [Streptomyces sp. NBC_01005]WTD00711.1 hypothetical protein OH736_43980 [Streptomyces sp. NBC_01650]
MKPSPAVLTNAYYAFYDLHRPTYHAYAAAHLPTEEARIATSKLFETVASTWTSVVAERRPSACAWQWFTQTVARRSGRTSTAIEDTHLLHHKLMLSVDQIATVTGAEPATVCARLAAPRRNRSPGMTADWTPGPFRTLCLGAVVTPRHAVRAHPAERAWPCGQPQTKVTVT